MRRVNKDGACVRESGFHRLTKNVFKYICLWKTAYIAFAECREVWNRLRHPIPQKPAICHVNFNLPNRLPHRPNSERILYQYKPCRESHGTKADARCSKGTEFEHWSFPQNRTQIYRNYSVKRWDYSGLYWKDNRVQAQMYLPVMYMTA